MNARGLAGFAVLAACATVPRGPPAYLFPPEFAASQVVEVHGDRGEQTLLASLWRSPGRFELTFLDPALLVPVVSARLEGERYAEERFVAFPLPSAQVEALVRDVADLYGSRSIQAEGAAWKVRVGHWDVALTPAPADTECPFPGRITLRVAGRSLPRIEVRTLDVRCGPR
ncbi:MAG TPA: hypothetical protein VMT17_06260 [Anaeromyxobacteraceae bacterium]|nr:hypothetical protein [Anaeromyxobacteraceae bacterium]